MASGRRPEHLAPPEVFYNETEARKYTSNTRMMEIQEQMAQRAVELLDLPGDVPCFLLDIGCGSGLSGDVLTEQGHYWVGFDISPSMLDVAKDREIEGDVFLHDAGQGLGFRPGTFDGCISISTLQWLCNADKRGHSPAKRLYKFFSSLYAALSRGSRAVFQFYPENSEQIELITSQAMRAGFGGGLVVDYPNSTKAKKMFLCLFAGPTTEKLPKGLTAEDEETSGQATVAYTSRREKYKSQGGKPLKKSREWILNKKARYRRQGKEVRQDGKFTGRKRKPNF